MADHLPSKDQLCGQCHRPIHPSDSRRHFGFYVAHGEGRCVQLLQMEIETLTRKLDTCGLECSEGLKRLAAENERLRTCLTGISTCSTCEACRGAAKRALGEAQTVVARCTHGNPIDPTGSYVCMKCFNEAKPVLPFTHWSKDPLVPYAGCSCSSCHDARLVVTTTSGSTLPPGDG